MRTHESGGKTEQQARTWSAKRLRQTGLVAMLGGVLGIVLSPIMTAAYHHAPEAATLSTPPWEPALTRLAEPLLTFAAPVTVYDSYGMLAFFTFGGVLVGVLGLWAHRRSVPSSENTPRIGRLEWWGFRATIAGLALDLFGNVGDYWLGEPEVVDLLGFLVGTVLGLLVLAVGLTLLGIVAWRTGSLPRVTAGLLVLWLPATLVVALVGLNNIPGGPLLTLGVVGMALGYHLWSATNDAHASIAPESPVKTERYQ